MPEPILPVYRIHPGIGIARLGNSPDEFCISPETPAAYPIACDRRGNTEGTPPAVVQTFKDEQGRIKRQAARFQIYVYDEKSPAGRPLALGDQVYGGGNSGVLVDIQWRVYLANKKACWYQFNQLEGEHGYLPAHPLRNPTLTDPVARRRLIIDPGPKLVSHRGSRTARFDRTGDTSYACTFPPEDLQPRPIDTLGELLTDDTGRLLVLGGHGHSGSFLSGFGQPRIDTYANNDGWFDDTSDGPVHARLVMHSQNVDSDRFIDVEYPSWVVAAYPAYVPQVLDMITLDDIVYNLGVTRFATRTDLYGKAGTFTDPQQIPPTDPEALALWQASSLTWNPDFKPWFYRDIWPILFRADEYTYLTNVLAGSNYPHNQTQRGNFDPTKLGVPPFLNPDSYRKAALAAAEANNSGQLFFEAVDNALLLLKQQEIYAEYAADPVFLMAFERTVDPRQKLVEALRNFAAVASGGLSPADPEALLANWKGAYAAAQSPESDTDAPYREVTAALKTALSDYAADQQRSTPPPAAAPHAPPSQQPATLARHLANILERAAGSFRSGALLADALTRARAAGTLDQFAPYRTYLYDLLRKGGEENLFRLESRPTSRVHHLPLMPLLCGDNPISNTLPSKFLRLTDYQLYLLRQWCEGKFFNEKLQGWVPPGSIDPWQPYLGLTSTTGPELDRHVLTNLAGGAFCPGAEIGWIIRNPAIFVEPYRIKADPVFSSFRQTPANQNATRVSEEDYIAYVDTGLSLGSDYSTGLQPGDLTKMMGLPWQADFNECSTQTIDVTYELWNQIDPTKPNDPWLAREDKVWETLWWPAHRPMQVAENIGTPNNPSFSVVNWARGIPQTKAGDLKMVTAWSTLGVVVRNPYAPLADLNQPSPQQVPKYVSIERTPDQDQTPPKP